MSEITYNSKMSSCCWITWIHDYEIIYEIILWIHLWIQCYEKYSELIIVTHGWSEVPIRYEIMVDFINLELIWIQHQICFSEGKVLLRQCNNGPFFATSFLPAPRLLHCCCCLTADVRCCSAQQYKEDMEGLLLTWRHHWRWDLPHMIVSNEGIFRNLQVDLLSTGKGLNLKDTTQRSSKGFQAGECKGWYCNA